MNLILADGKGLERRLMIQQPGGGRTPSRSEGMGQLQDRENPLVILFPALLLANIRKQTEVVLLNRDLAAPGSEFALRTMLIEDQWWRCGCGLLSGYSAKYSLSLVNQTSQRNGQGCILAAVDNSADARR